MVRHRVRWRCCRRCTLHWVLASGSVVVCTSSVSLGWQAVTHSQLANSRCVDRVNVDIKCRVPNAAFRVVHTLLHNRLSSSFHVCESRCSCGVVRRSDRGWRIMDVGRAIEARGVLLFPMSMCVASGIVCATCGALVWPPVEGPSIEASIDRGGEKRCREPLRNGDEPPTC